MKRIFPLLSLAFLALLIIIFHEFIFDSSKLMLNSDQLNGIGSRFLRTEHFILPEWDDSRLGGIPTLEALFSDAYHPLVLAQFLMAPDRAVGFKFIITIWVAFMSAFILARYLTDKWQYGALLAFLYALSPQYFSFIYGGHDGKMMVFAIAPFAMFCLLKILRENSLGAVLKYVAYFSLCVVWMILSSHLQLTYFFLWGAGLFALFELFSQKFNLQEDTTAQAITGGQFTKKLSLAALALAIGLLISAFQIIPPYIYTTTQSVRGSGEKTTIEHSASWSLHNEELANYIIPNFIGMDVHEGQPTQDDNRYWGHNPFKLNADSCGILLTVLAFLGLFSYRNRWQSLFWFLGCALALSYAMGLHSPLFSLWYNIIPGVKNFRAPSMSLFWLPLAFVFLAAPVLKSLDKSEEQKNLAKQLGLFAGLALLVVIARYSWESFNGIFGAICMLAFGGTFLYFRNKFWFVENTTSHSIKKSEMALWFLPFILFALFFVFGANNISEPYFKPLDIAAMNHLSGTILSGFVLLLLTCGVVFFILKSNLSIVQKSLAFAVVASVELFITLSPFVQNVNRSLYYNPKHPIIQAIEKDSPNLLERPRVLSVSRMPAISGNVFPAYNMRNSSGFHDNEIGTYRAFRENVPQDVMLNLTNSGYIIFDSQQGARIQKNPEAISAKLYSNWQTLPYEQINNVLQNFDYKNTLILEEESLIPQEFVSQDTNSAPIQSNSAHLVKKDKDDFLVYETESNSPALLFISQNFHPNWNAKVNGKQVKVYRAFGTFTAVWVPNGKATVELWYESAIVKTSLLIGLAGVILLTALIIISIKKRN